MQITGLQERQLQSYERELIEHHLGPDFDELKTIASGVGYALLHFGGGLSPHWVFTGADQLASRGEEPVISAIARTVEQLSVWGSYEGLDRIDTRPGNVGTLETCAELNLYPMQSLTEAGIAEAATYAPANSPAAAPSQQVGAIAASNGRLEVAGVDLKTGMYVTYPLPAPHPRSFFQELPAPVHAQ